MAGEYPAVPRDKEATRQKLRQYLDAGITYFVDLTNRGEKPPYLDLLQQEAVAMGLKESDVQYRRLPIRDFGIPDAETMRNILDTIDEAIKTNHHKVYVHCRGGIGRTGVTVGCYLVRNGNSGQEALDEVNRLFQNSARSMESDCSPETTDQMNFVRNWGEGKNSLIVDRYK